MPTTTTPTTADHPSPGPVLRYCPACRTAVETFAKGPGGRPDATCPTCRSLERHRFQAILLDGLAPVLGTARLVVEVAPSGPTTRLLQELAPQAHLSLDFDPAADGRAVDVRASLTDLPLPDGSVDLLICYHVLEHVPDDRSAMLEIARVLAPGGLALLQVPWRRDQETDEDPSAPVAERITRFGQADHVRYYGRDVDDRLRAAGLSVTRTTPAQVVGDQLCAVMGLMGSETVWVARRADGRRAGPDLGRTWIEGLFAAVVPDGIESSAALGVQLARARADATRWEGAYRRLRGRAPIRAAARLATVVSRARRRR